MKIYLCIILLISIVCCKSDYKVTANTTSSSQIVLNLTYIGNQDYYVKPTSPIIKQLQFIFHSLAFNDFAFKIIDPSNKRYEVPQYGIFPIDPLANFSFPLASSAVRFEFSPNPFDFKITRKQNQAVLFSTYDQNIIFSDYYLEIGTEVNSEYIYGIGERFQDSFRRKNGKWTIFNRDRGQQIDSGDGRQTYGFYPFYLLRQKGELFHVNYFRSSNAMDIIISNRSGKHYVTYKTIGGIFDFRFFLGQGSPEATIEKLHFYSGRALIPPFWGFGFHQCRYGYANVSVVQNVLKNYQINGLPLDTIWTDIDYMLKYEDFTIDESRWPLERMKNITDRYRYIPIIDAGIKNSGSAYEQGLKRNVFILDGQGKNPYVGQVWPGKTTFVDFFHPNATKYWGDMLARLYEKVKFSGIWLDMNQIANFCNGVCEGSAPATAKRFDYTNDLPYQPGRDNIESAAISLNSTHYGNVTEANVHAYFGFLQTYATNQYLNSLGSKPFIISRSSTLGSAKYGFHWTGDNRAEWVYLKGSIADQFSNQLFGMQMVGPDICGFGGDTTVQLCARWFQIGALYPFARDHNDNQGVSQQPYALGDIVLQSAKNNLKLRYALLKYFYYLFVTKKGLGTIWRPLFFQFPENQGLYIDEIADTHFLIGPNILATPIVEPNVTSRKVYFPNTSWYDFHTGIKHGPGTQVIECNLTSKVPIFLKQGSIGFMQDTTDVVNTKQLNNSFTLFSGMRFNQRRSNNSFQLYESTGTILSIKDYNDDSLISQCVSDGCEYIMTFVAAITNSTRNLEINFVYQGKRGLNQQIFIDQVHLAFGTEIVIIPLAKPLEVTGNQRVNLDIPRMEAQKKELKLSKE